VKPTERFSSEKTENSFRQKLPKSKERRNQMRIKITSKVLVSILILSILITCIAAGFAIKPAEAATSNSTLAETLNNIINNVDWTYGNSWTTNWAIILANQPNTAFENAATQDVGRGDYLDALYVARLADLNGYTSDTISQVTQSALQQIPMCGSLPITANAHSYGDPDVLNSGCFLVYQRFALWGYQYATQYGLTSKWNAIQAFTDFANAYDKKPTGSVSGEMLWCDPQENWAESYSSRYYDEHAETLSTFLQFAEQGVPNAMTYADKAWTGIQAHWNGQYYGYTGTTTVECEMGNFAQVIAEYKDQKGGTIPYWDRVISDLNYKLLANGWNSPGWASPGVLIHAKGVNNQLRLMETMGATIALQNQFPFFSTSMKTTWPNMLMGSNPAWQGLIASSLDNGGHFSPVSGSTPSNDATVCAAATLFLYGIVPITGNLAIPNREEYYNDLRTPFSTSDFKFDYTNRLIRIPVNAGTITFIYGSSPISYTFPNNGVYTIQFSNDWNLITAVNGQPIITNPPSPPTNLKATAGNAQVTLTWSAPTSDGGAPITGYKLYKGTAQGQESVTITLGTALNYTDLAVTNDQTYYYYITAMNAAGESTPSNEASATPTAPTLKTMTIGIKTDKATYTRGSTVAITVTVKDSTAGTAIKGASATVTIYGPNGKATWTGTSTTNSNGIATLSYKLSYSAQRGTYTVAATVTNTGYQSGTAQTSFNVA
jgi:hypothetical protein